MGISAFGSFPGQVPFQNTSEVPHLVLFLYPSHPLSGQESSTSLVYTRTVEDSRVEPGNSARHEEGQIRRVFERTRHFSLLSTLVYH